MWGSSNLAMESDIPGAADIQHVCEIVLCVSETNGTVWSLNSQVLPVGVISELPPICVCACTFPRNVLCIKVACSDYRSGVVRRKDCPDLYWNELRVEFVLPRGHPERTFRKFKVDCYCLDICVKDWFGYFEQNCFD